MFATFINWTAEDTNAMVGHMGNLIDDLVPLLTPIIAIAVGLIIVGAIIRAVRG